MNTIEMKIANLCKTLAQEAGNRSWTAFLENKSLSVEEKMDKSLLTEWDGRIETWMRNEINHVFPDHNIFGEELDEVNNNSSYTWTLDPIDGTSNFSMGVPLFGSMVSVSKNSTMLVAAVSLPSTQSVYWVNQEGKTSVNHEPFTLGKGRSLQHSTIIVEKGRSERAEMDFCRYISQRGIGRTTRRYGNVCAGVGAMLSGKPVVHIVFDANLYDLAPAACLYKNAGFAVVNKSGESWKIIDRDLIAAHPDSIEEVMKNV